MVAIVTSIALVFGCSRLRCSPCQYFQDSPTGAATLKPVVLGEIKTVFFKI